MESNEVGFDCCCNGDFIVDSIGIRSVRPVDVASEEWNGNTLVLKGSDRQCNNIVSVGGMSITGVSSNTIMVNGVKYVRETPVDNSNMKMVSVTWAERGINNPVLADLSSNGSSGSISVQIPLAETCSIDMSGTSSVQIHGSWPTTALTVSLSGACSLTGEGTVDKLMIGLSGAGNISGFHALKVLKARVSGMGNVILTHDPKCKVTQNVSGMGRTNIRLRE